MTLFNEYELRLYGIEFLCQLYRTAEDIIERRFNRYKIFGVLAIYGIQENAVLQATDEIVQFLYIQCNSIRTIENSDDIYLTRAGLAESNRICRDILVV
jgi:hypothetical protein